MSSNGCLYEAINLDILIDLSKFYSLSAWVEVSHWFDENQPPKGAIRLSSLNHELFINFYEQNKRLMSQKKKPLFVAKRISTL
jgi:hypothetical protein